MNVGGDTEKQPDSKKSLNFYLYYFSFIATYPHLRNMYNTDS